MKPIRSLRWHLAQVVLLGVLPVGIFAAALLYFHWEAQQAERARIQLETTRILAAAVDNEMDGTIKRLSMLGRLFSVPGADLRLLHEHAVGAVAASPDWILVLAATGEGKGLLRSDVPPGTPIPPIDNRPYFKTALAELRPVVSDLFVSPVTGERVVGVAVPWVTNGKVSHVLAASLNLRWFDELLRSQGLPPGGIGGIFDARMQFVARSHDGDARRGTDPAPALHADMQRQREGIGRYPSLDNTSVYTSWTRTRHGYWVALATPAAPIDGAFWRYMGLLAGLLLAMLAASFAFAAMKSTQITNSLVHLGRRAAQLAGGRSLAPAQPSRIQEVDRVLRAVDDAAALLATAHAERDQLLEAEQKARAAAERANRAKDEFLAMLGHELRNPLAAVSNAAAILGSGECTAQHHAFAAGVIQRQSAHLKRLIDDLLDVGRVMTGKILLERRALDLAASVRHVLATLQTAGLLSRHAVSDVLAPVWVHGDQTRLEQVVSNLLVNAATYTPAGGAIRVSLTEAQGDAVLEIADTGQGIRAEHIERIFELFFQAEAAGRGAHGGLGIGLTLVKRLVELHGGTIAVKSEGPDRGATFMVRLPATAAAHRPGETLAVVKNAPTTVLVVEDNADERESLRVALELHGHRVLQAGDARSALEEIERGRPSVALVDIGLPGIDGYALAREIHARGGAKPLLVALTGYGSDEDARLAREAGFARHLTKPVPVVELAAIVSRAVS